MNVFSLARTIAKGDQTILESGGDDQGENQIQSAGAKELDPKLESTEAGGGSQGLECQIEDQNQIPSDDMEMDMDGAAAALESLVELTNSMGVDTAQLHKLVHKTS